MCSVLTYAKIRIYASFGFIAVRRTEFVIIRLVNVSWYIGMFVFVYVTTSCAFPEIVIFCYLLLVCGFDFYSAFFLLMNGERMFF